jgi:hypothetical protein
MTLKRGICDKTKSFSNPPILKYGSHVHADRREEKKNYENSIKFIESENTCS